MSPAASLVDFHATLERLGVPHEVASVETVAARVRRLQAEAKALARDHVKALTAAMVDLESLAADIANGGDAYLPGTRELARQLIEDLDARALTLAAITARAGR